MQVGDLVLKASGDYRYHGHIVAAFQKRSGRWRDCRGQGLFRYVVENTDGMLVIFNAAQLARRCACSRDAVPGAISLEEGRNFAQVFNAHRRTAHDDLLDTSVSEYALVTGVAPRTWVPL